MFFYIDGWVYTNDAYGVTGVSSKLSSYCDFSSIKSLASLSRKSRISASLHWELKQGHIKSLRSFDNLLFSHQLMSSVDSSIIGLLGIYPYYKLAALFSSVMLFRQLKKGRDGNLNGLPLPPGPKGYPLIGNLFDMPVDRPWVVFDEWRKTYGKTFIINGLSPQITGYLRRYDIPQCPWPALCNFKFIGSHHRPV